MKGARFNYYIKRVHELPLRAVMKKALMKSVSIVACKLQKARARLSPVHISDKQLLKSLDGFASLQEALSHIKGERPRFFIGPSLKGEIVSLIQREFPQLKEEIIVEADKVCAHIFDLLGSGPVNLDEFVERHGGSKACGYLPWHFGFKVGYRWNPRKFYKEIKPAYGKADIKVPWELSRFQHVATLGQAYWLTGNEKYAQEFVRQVDDWIDHNPPKFGVNWACTMDVAIRAVNWIFGFYFFADAKEISDEFWMKFLKSLFLHGRFIRGNLEIGYNDAGKRITSNHYLSNIVGLIFLGMFFKATKEGKEWLDFGIKELIQEMYYQVHPDGTDFESSIPYHRLVLELFATSAILCKINKIEFPQRFWERLEKMFEFVMYYTKPDGKAPQIGDNDNGRLWILSNYGNWDVNDHRYLLGIGAVLFNREDFAKACNRQWEEAIWLTNKLSEDNRIKKYLKMVHDSRFTIHNFVGSKAFPDGGYYIMRDKDNYMIISAGRVGTNGIGNHKHNDVFSFELCFGGRPFIIDPGTYVYTSNPKMRNLFRSTAYHNTILIDNEEQNRFDKEEVLKLFRMFDDSKPTRLKWKSNSDYDLFEGEHYGYQRLSDPVIHRRRVYFNKKEKYWQITDSLFGKNEHSLECLLHFAPSLKFEIINKLDLHVWNNNTKVVISPVTSEGYDLFLEIQQDWFSPEYGVRFKVPVAVYKIRTSLPTSLSFLIRKI